MAMPPGCSPVTTGASGGESAAAHAAVRGARDAPGRLPRPRTSFVGRENELAQARQLLDHNRLLTLTGPGGCGKTRLSIALAASAMNDFPTGVHFVPLAAIRDPSLVPVSIAQSFGLQDARGGPLLEHLSGYVGDRKLLLVLDNFEHLLSAGEFVQELLAGSIQLRILVTSRSPLHLSGEQEFAVPALGVPEPGGARSVTAVAACESAQLFAARAAALVPGFNIDEQNAGAIAGIVERLDGLPLAIELVAARVKLLPPVAILARLEHSLDLLVSGGRDAPDRQRTLRATIAWSYGLLSEAARRLLAAVSVFRGGISLECVEAVCVKAPYLGVPVLDALQELVDHSLLRLAVPFVPVPRYVMLETVREFAAEQLSAMPEAAAIHAAHAAQFGHLARDLARSPCWPAREGLDLLELEHDNFRAALDWYRREDPSGALRLANRLTAFWSARGHFSEGRQRLGELLDLVAEDDPERIDAMNGLAWLATDQGDFAAANALFERSIARARAARDAVGEGTALFYRGRSRLMSGDFAGGGPDIARAMELQAAAGNEAMLAAALWFSALPPMVNGELDVTCERFERCVELSEALDLPAVSARGLQLLGVARIEQGDLRGARAALAQGVPAIADIGDRFAMPAGLSALAGLAAKTGRPRAALMLAGAAAEYERVNHTYLPQRMRALLDAWLEPVRATLGAAAAKLLDEGRRLALDEAIALGLDDQPEDRWRAGPSPGLTRREQEVAALVARGMTNREIAGQLCLSIRTVETHVDRVLSKLGFRTRTQLTAWAHEEGLLPRDT
jgi:predicted ATPase/DNA-binding CsgD family transcriptional regulator